jgi:hypothetical protein
MMRITPETPIAPMIRAEVPLDDQTLPRRYFILSEKDIAAFSDRLAEALPRTRCYIGTTSYAFSKGPAPELLSYRRLADVHTPQSFIVFDPTCVPRWEPSKYGKHWNLVVPGFPHALFVGSGKVMEDREGPPPFIRSGEIHLWCDRRDKRHASLARKVFRLLTMTCTNAYAHVDYPSMKVAARFEKGGSVWIGPDAARWCLERPDRVLDLHRHPEPWGYRPLG